ncbi:hypothetical protein EXIGLDRAFT_780666 [Exidia glandulosa HHB12029]|uniref:F-box domain-containing protein n=1 Tax=Exidia glandulosa HHB12029 TaxID=1314781 RepID=A0A165Z9U5_EXIGL|nr:hypothetical protein EXIGLDRAFT_780666 [Exidia glandulosa HHB12029]
MPRIPHELWLRTFLFLNAKSIPSLKAFQVSKLFRALVTESPSLQLAIELEDGGLTLLRSEGAARTLERVKAWRKAWLELGPSLRTTIDVPFKPGGLYELAGGYFFLSLDNTNGGVHPNTLAYTMLPGLDTAGQEYGKWEYLKFEETMVDFVVEFDQGLLCFVEQHRRPSRENLTFRVHFRTIFGGAVHPGAAKSFIEYAVPTHGRDPDFMITPHIVGVHVIVHFWLSTWEDDVRRDCIVIWDWTTGQLKGTINESMSSAVNTFAVLSAHQLILPALDGESLEVYSFDASSTQPSRPIRLQARFDLPFPLISYMFRSEPNSFGSSPYAQPRRTFGVDPEKSIICFTMRTGDPDESDVEGFVATRAMFLSHISAAQRHGTDSVLRVHWHAWAHNTRWDKWDWPPKWNRHTIGSRHVGFLHADGFGPIYVLDFNKMLRVPDVDANDPDRLSCASDITQSSISTVPGGFTSLTCMESVWDEQFEYDGVVMDEDRIIGLTVNDEDDVTSLEVFVMGGPPATGVPRTAPAVDHLPAAA